MSERIGYTTGIFDIFHIGHLNILKNARSQCDRLIVGVTTDELAEKLKGRKPVIPFDERIEIVRSICFVDEVFPEDKDDKIGAHRKLGFNLIFKGDDWKGTDKWNRLEKEFNELGVRVVFFPYTRTTSSTVLRTALERVLEV